MNSEGPSSPAESSGGDEYPSFDTSVVHVARIYDYWLSGKALGQRDQLDLASSHGGTFLLGAGQRPFVRC